MMISMFAPIRLVAQGFSDDGNHSSIGSATASHPDEASNEEDPANHMDIRPESPEPSTPEGASVESTDEDELTLDIVFALLENQRRRDTLHYLEANDGSARLDELAEAIAAKENDVEIPHLTSQQRKRVYIALYQCHLPKLDGAGVIDYEQARGTIELNETADRLFRYLNYRPPSEKAAQPMVVLKRLMG